MESIVSVIVETSAGEACACFNTRMRTATDTCEEIFSAGLNPF